VSIAAGRGALKAGAHATEALPPNARAPAPASDSGQESALAIASQQTAAILFGHLSTAALALSGRRRPMTMG
jgi:hypothetical protein